MTLEKKKIKNLIELKTILKNKDFALCHGTFDIVHPGHLRQFIYAKKYTKILVVSLTGDEFILKGNLKPYVNENLRALNLSVINLVDYVLIDNNLEPISLIKKIKPKFFIKGYEYKNLTNEKTVKEKNTVEKYGGKIIFSPGDYIYSSTKIITDQKPNLKYEKLYTLLDKEKLSIDEIIKTTKEFSKKKVIIIGDTIVDRYSNAGVIGGMHKSPTLSVQILNSQDYIGGAAIVAMHIKALGADVTFCSIIGNDKEGNFVRQTLKKNKINTNLVVLKNRNTSLKNNIICQNHKILKIDRVDNDIIGKDTLFDLFKFNIKKFDTIILSDFRHGIFNIDNIKLVNNFLNKKIYKVADTQVASRWGNLLDFKNFDLLTPNEREIRFALADQDTVLRPLGKKLMDKIKCKNLFIKLGNQGVMSIRDYNKYKKPSFHLDSFVDSSEVLDPVGAGDAFLAYSALGMTVSGNDLASCILGTIAAGESCRYIGNKPVGLEKVNERLLALNAIVKNIKIF